MQNTVSSREYLALKQEKEEIEQLLDDSLGTIEILKEKYDLIREENVNLMKSLEEVTIERDRLKKAQQEADELIKETQTDLIIAKKVDSMLNAKAVQKGLPTNAIEISKAILRSEIAFNELEGKLVEDLRSLADQACDGLVEIESNHSLLLEQFPSVSFVKKEERDPYKGIPRRPTPDQPAGYLFGSPSKRFPVFPDEEVNIRETEEDNDDELTETVEELDH